jgi:hypothetical protein
MSSQDIFYVNFGAWHRKNNADWANFVPALEALGKDYSQNKGTWPHLLFRENAAIHPKNLDKKVCDNVPGVSVGLFFWQSYRGAAPTGWSHTQQPKLPGAQG